MHRLAHLVALWGLPLLSCRGSGTDSPPPPTPEAGRASLEAAEDAPPDPGVVQGRLSELGGHRVLHLWGSPRQMGFAHGALLREGIIEVVEHYALRVIPQAKLSAVGPIYERVADISPALREEAAGIIEGMQSAGGAKIPGLGRDLTATDLLVLNAMTDLLSIGCSSVSAWGAATASDSTLNGETAIVRNLDWSSDDALLANQVVIAYTPSEPGHQRVVSVAFAGFIGCLSCFNEAGVGALFNMGYGEGAATMTDAMAGFAPANLMLRDALQHGDVDGDGDVSASDVEAALRSRTHAGSYIVHVVEPFAIAQRAHRAPARVLEIEADGIATRSPTTTDGLGSNLLAATNHLRAKSQPRSCSRYARIEETAHEARGALDRDTLWALGTRVRLPEVVHTMLLEPDTRRLTLWLRQPGEPPSSSRGGVVHEWASLFE